MNVGLTVFLLKKDCVLKRGIIMNKQPEITAQTKQNLIDAFWQIYRTKRIDKITVRDITLKAGYNRSTFYEYFTDVYDVLEQIEESILPDPKELPQIDFSGSEMHDNIDDLLKIDDFGKMFYGRSNYYTVLLGENGDPNFLLKLKNSMTPKVKLLMIANGVPDDFELEYILEFTTSAMIGVLNHWFTHEGSQPSLRLFNLINGIMCDGVVKTIAKSLAPQ
jgi:AcrR family transcriptional regulator